MSPRLVSPPSRSMRFSHSIPTKSRWFSVRGIAKISLALIVFLYFFGSSLSAGFSKSRSTPHNNRANPPKSPLQSGLSQSALDRLHNFASAGHDPHDAGSFDSALAHQNEVLAKEEEEKKRKEEEERKHKEDERKQREEEEKKLKEAEERKKKQEEETKQKEAEEEAKKKQEEEKKADNDNKQDEEKGDITLDKENSGSTNQGPKNPNELTTTLVTGRTSESKAEAAWIDNLLKDITHKRIYIVDDPNADLHLNQNKGRESMVYIKYILDFYDNLDDVTIFFHPSRDAWHNNVLHNRDGATMINNLRRAWVVERGYMNARCEWWPGCQQWVRWNATKEQTKVYPTRFADLFSAELWDRLFPNRTHNPVFLSQPCCSQFAASRETIRSVSKDQYQRLHDWLGTTETDDSLAGRVMEYTWQYLFLDQDESCPDMLECYCKGYGLCLTDPGQIKELQRYNHLRGDIDETLEKLDAWDKHQGCHDIPDEKEEEKLECKKDNPWGTPLFKTRAEKMTLEREMPKRFGVMKP